MAQAEYKNMTKDYKNFNLSSAVAIALKGWRESYNEHLKGLFCRKDELLYIGTVAKAIGERYETVYRLENCGGTSIALAKYLLFIRQRDPKFDFCERIKDILGDKFPKY